jgi:hypothetical protein
MDKKLIDFDDEFSTKETTVHQEKEVFHEDPRMNSRRDNVCN